MSDLVERLRVRAERLYDGRYKPGDSALGAIIAQELSEAADELWRLQHLVDCVLAATEQETITEACVYINELKARQ